LYGILFRIISPFKSKNIKLNGIWGKVLKYKKKRENKIAKKTNKRECPEKSKA